MTKTYRVGLVGCGGMGMGHLRTIRDKLPEFELVALCDVFAEAEARARQECGDGPVFYRDCERMYDEAGLDVVAVATQTRGHCAPTVAALRQGISVLCEKPIAIDLAEADAMVAAQQGGARLAINQQNHVNPGIRKAQALVAQGAIGEVVLVRGRNKAGRKSGNEFMEMGTHVTDMMLCFGGAPQWCSGTVYYQGRLAEVGDIMEAKEMSPRDRDSGPVVGARAVGLYGFANGVQGEIRFVDYAQTNGNNYGVDILGTQGQLAVRASGGVKGGNVWHLPHPMEGLPSEAGDWQQVELGTDGDRDAIATMYRELLGAAETGVEPPGSGEEGRWAFEMVLGLYESHRQGGGRVELPMDERGHPLENWRAEAAL